MPQPSQLTGPPPFEPEGSAIGPISRMSAADGGFSLRIGERSYVLNRGQAGFEVLAAVALAACSNRLVVELHWSLAPFAGAGTRQIESITVRTA